VASFASRLASSAKVACSLAVRIWIIGGFLLLVASTAVVGSGISHAHTAAGVKVEVKTYIMFLILFMMAYLLR
jgi:hypothetical protein